MGEYQGQQPTSVRIDPEKARQVLRRESAQAEKHEPDAEWGALLSDLQDATSQYKTYIAILATALLAKSCDVRANPYALKVGDPEPGSYAARSLATAVLVPEAGVLGIDLGVSGPEPHNNQPFWRFTSVSLDMQSVVRPRAKPALDALIACLARLSQCRTEAEARVGLRSFIALRRFEEIPPLDAGAESPASPGVLERLITAFVTERSEGGRRAQAVVAGLFSATFGADAVVSGRINDPSRHYPGDVAIIKNHDWRAVVEVRDKPVSEGDLWLFARRVVKAEISRAAFVGVAAKQQPLDSSEVVAWGLGRGLAYQVFCDWCSLIAEVFSRADGDLSALTSKTHAEIDARLMEAEVSVEGIEAWRAWRKTAGVESEAE